MTAELDTVGFWLSAAQLLLIVVLVLAVIALLVGKPRETGDLSGPYLRGFLGPVVVTLAVVLGGLLSAVVAIAAARPFGDPIPSGSDPATGIVVPGLLCAYAAAPLCRAAPTPASAKRRGIKPGRGVGLLSGPTPGGGDQG
jgi:hypothetical protein